MAQEELDGYDSFTSPVANKMPLWKFAEQTPSGSQAQSKTKTATTQAQPVTSTLVRPAAPQGKDSAQAEPQAPVQAQIRPPAPSQAGSSLLPPTSGRFQYNFRVIFP